MLRRLKWVRSTILPVAWPKLGQSLVAPGEFRSDFDAAVMAMAIRETIDAVPRRLANDPELDVEHYGRELANVFDVATRGAASGSRTRRR